MDVTLVPSPVGPVEFRCCDPFGVAALTRVSGDRSMLCVHPAFDSVAPLRLGGAGVDGAQQGSTRTTSHGEDFYALREYQDGDDLRARLRDNTAWFRARLAELGFDILPGDHPIVPVMIGDAARAARLADLLLARGIYVIGFSYPVVPVGKARIRTQLSAAHTRADLELAAAAFAAARDELGSEENP